MNFVNNSHSKITITKDKNLEYDPYFYERKKDLENILFNLKYMKRRLVS